MDLHQAQVLRYTKALNKIYIVKQRVMDIDEYNNHINEDVISYHKTEDGAINRIQSVIDNEIGYTEGRIIYYSEINYSESSLYDWEKNKQELENNSRKFGRHGELPIYFIEEVELLD